MEGNEMKVQGVRIGDFGSFRQGHDFYGPVKIVQGEVREEQERPKPCSNVPFRRDKNFVYREYLSEIQSRGKEPAARVGLVGLGGTGKSQLAIEYAHLLREEDPDRWVFWVHASSLARFEEGYKRIAETVRIPGHHTSTTSLLDAVWAWLSDENNGRWVMIIDNADNPDVFHAPISTKGNEAGANKTLLHFLPTSPNGFNLVTSRHKEVARELVEDWKNVLEIETMELPLAEELLVKKLPAAEGQDKAEEVRRLAQRLDCVPLAMSQAATFIAHRSPRMTISKYLELLEETEGGMSDLLKTAIRDGRRDDLEHGVASYSTFATWQVTFMHLREKKPSACKLLSLMSLFDRHGIPENLIKGAYDDSDDPPSYGRSYSTAFDDDVLELQNYSLISMTTEGNSFEMHRLVQKATKEWLRQQGELLFWTEKYVSVLRDRLPRHMERSFTRWGEVIAHVQLLSEYETASEDVSIARAKLSNTAMDYFGENLQPKLAEKIVRESLRQCQSSLGDDHPSTLFTMAKLATVLNKKADLEGAEQIYETLLRDGAPPPGPSRSHLLAVKIHRGYLRYCQDRNEEAEAELKEVLDELRSSPDAKRDLFYECLHCLGMTLVSLGRHGEAEKCFQEGYEEHMKERGADDLGTHFFVYDRANMLHSLKQLDEAERLCRQALQGFERQLGASSDAVMAAKGFLAEILVDQGKFSEAEGLAREALAAQDEGLKTGADFKISLITLLARITKELGKLTEAEQLGLRALAIQEERGFHTTKVVHFLARVYWDKKDWAAAEQWHRRLLELLEAAPSQGGEKDVKGILTNMFVIGVAIRMQGRDRLADAEAMYRAAYEAAVPAWGEEDDSTKTYKRQLDKTVDLRRRLAKLDESKAKAEAEAESRANEPGLLSWGVTRGLELVTGLFTGTRSAAGSTEGTEGGSSGGGSTGGESEGKERDEGGSTGGGGGEGGEGKGKDRGKAENGEGSKEGEGKEGEGEGAGGAGGKDEGGGEEGEGDAGKDGSKSGSKEGDKPGKVS